MTPAHDTSARERLIAAATELFSRYGYAATSARTIANQAQTNVAMISYYFGGKQGLLEAVFSRYFEEGAKLAAELEAQPADVGLEAMLGAVLPRVVTFFRHNPDLVRVVFAESAHDEPHAASQRTRLFRDLVARTLGPVLPELRRRGLDGRDAEALPTLMMGAIAFHFLAKDLLAESHGAVFDDAFYQRLPEIITAMAVGGVEHLASATKRPRSKKS